jgi:hypothetical protein
MVLPGGTRAPFSLGYRRFDHDAVLFARKLARDPISISDADYTTLRAEFGDGSASEVVVQTCAFASMNRFPDHLRVASEDEAVREYRELHGADWK